MASARLQSDWTRFKEELAAMRKNWGFLLAIGITQVVLGLIALSLPLLFTLGTMLFFGLLLVVAGVVDIGSAFWARKWRGFLLHLLVGILYLSVALFFVERPGLAAAGFTLMLAVFFLVGGLFRIVVALSQRFPGWGWALANGVITLLLGVLIWQEWPESAVWVIGTFIGIELIFNGCTWVMLALALRNSRLAGTTSP